MAVSGRPIEKHSFADRIKALDRLFLHATISFFDILERERISCLSHPCGRVGSSVGLLENTSTC